MDRAALESAATTYPNLRGLFAIPAGALMVASGVYNQGWGPFGRAWGFLGCIALAALVALGIQRYYRDTYGSVTLSGRARARMAVVVAISMAAFLGVNVLLGSSDRPVSVLCISFGAVLLVNYAAYVGLRVHHVAIAGALMIAGLLPIWGDADSSRDSYALIAMGVASAAIGIADHRLLARMLRPGAAELGGGDVRA